MRLTLAGSRSTSAAAGGLRALALVLLLGAVAACGGGDGSSAPAVSQPPPTTPPPTAAAPSQKAVLLRLYESAEVHARLTAAALEYATIDYRLWTNGPCAYGRGSLLATLDGGAMAAGMNLPAGSHTFSVSFANCPVDVLVGTVLSGTATAAYTSVNLIDFTALVSAISMRGKLVAFLSDLDDVTANGSGTWKRVTTSTGSTTIYTPTIGSTLANNLTTNTLTFVGGSYSNGSTVPPAGSSSSVRRDFANLAVSINGTNYILDGSLQSVSGFGGNDGTHTGEIRITSGQTLVARIYGDASGAFGIEVLTPLVPF